MTIGVAVIGAGMAGRAHASGRRSLPTPTFTWSVWWWPTPCTANGLALEVFGDKGAAKWEQERPAEFQLMLNEGPSATNGYRRVIIGPDHPYVAGGLPMDAAPGVGLGQNEGFVYRARAFLEEVAGIDEVDALPRCASFDEGVHNMEVLAAVAESAANGGAAVALAPQREPAARTEAVAQ
jgi:predicted dehydrogenase